MLNTFLRVAVLTLVLGAPALTVAQTPETTASPQAPAASNYDPRQSTVRIFSTRRIPQLFQPWTKGAATESTGTGFFVIGAAGERLLLTNNHVVAWASQIYVQGYQSSDRHRAQVVATAPDFDLAILKLDDVEALAQRPALTLTEALPTTRASVAVYGYPTGGNELSVTRGIISRVEVAAYKQNAVGLRVQVDAAINPGNSGGPALVDKKVMGVAFMAATDAENIGYLIPAVEVRRFLNDAASSPYDGKPNLLVNYQSLENPAVRRWLGLTSEQTGVLVGTSAPGYDTRPSDNLLRDGDVLTHIGPHAIDNRGQVEIAPDLRGVFRYFVDTLTTAEGTVPLTVIRDGKTVTVQQPATTDPPLLLPHLGNDYPRFYIFGPLVFTQSTRAFYTSIGERFRSVLSLRKNTLILRAGDRQAFPEEELVSVASPFFSHPIVRGYDNPLFSTIESVNGVPIRNLEHLVRVLNEDESEFLRIRFGQRGSRTLVFDRKEMQEATEEILNDNGIRYRASPDLRELAESYE